MVENKKKRIGLLGGSFNPVHFGHLHIASELQKLCQLDEVWFIPTWISPHKQSELPVSSEHRVNMLQLALVNKERFKVVDAECRRKGISYTIETLKELTYDHPGCEFFLLLGTDTVKRFHQWKAPLEILSLAQVVVASREDDELKFDFNDRALQEGLKKHFYKIPPLHVSSTEIRQNIFQRKECDSLLPETVIQYIKKYQLYTK